MKLHETVCSYSYFSKGNFNSRTFVKHSLQLLRCLSKLAQNILQWLLWLNTKSPLKESSWGPQLFCSVKLLDCCAVKTWCLVIRTIWAVFNDWLATGVTHYTISHQGKPCLVSKMVHLWRVHALKMEDGGQSEKDWKRNPPHMWWWRGPWRHYSTTGSIVLLMAAQRKPGAPMYTQTNTLNWSQSCICEHMFMIADVGGMCFQWVSYRVFLLFMQRESGAKRDVGLRMERPDWDGWIGPARSTNRRLREKEEAKQTRD